MFDKQGCSWGNEMQIHEFRVQSLSSFEDSGLIQLGPGLNFVVGQNNSGKSALISSLRDFSHNPHRNADLFQQELLQPSTQSIKATFSPRALAIRALRNGPNLHWPVFEASQSEATRGHREMCDFFTSDVATLSLKRGAGSIFAITEGAANAETGLTLEARMGTDLQPTPVGIQSGPSPSLPGIVYHYWHENVFYFSAQRYNVGTCAINMPSRLNSDANNLPAVLMRLSGDRGDLFRELTQHMRDIFPSVKNLSVTSPPDSQTLKILVWPTLEQRHPELSVGLDDSGTGLSQVLAILTVAMIMDATVIVIDEISSFLHPAAAKALVRILESHYGHHQYVISTHSPEVISACSPSTVHLVKKIGFRSTITPIDLSSVLGIREVTNELGVSMTDVFASDRVVWVEGPTEEKGFAYIFEQTRDARSLETSASAPQFTAVVATGDFARRERRELVFEIYSRLTSAAATIAASASFAFDREGLSPQQMEDLDRGSNGRVKFLPRRLFECFLIDPAAITRVINAELDEDDHVSPDVVAQRLIALAAETRFKARDEWRGSLSGQAWLEKVDAASLLAAVFTDVTRSRLEFSKRRHSFEILRDMLETNPAMLSDLIEFVKSLAVDS